MALEDGEWVDDGPAAVHAHQQEVPTVQAGEKGREKVGDLTEAREIQGGEQAEEEEVSEEKEIGAGEGEEIGSNPGAARPRWPDALLVESSVSPTVPALSTRNQGQR